MCYVQLLFKMPFSRLTFFFTSFFMQYLSRENLKLASPYMNGHYCGHYTTNDIEGKITEY